MADHGRTGRACQSRQLGGCSASLPKSGTAGSRGVKAPEQSAAFARRLQDPAVVARILHNVGSDQEIYKLTR
jgi:hypothetical protein